MTSTGNQGDGCFRTKSIHFHKILLADSLRDGKLRIPTKFVKIYGEGLSDTVYLKLPSGAQWKVNLEKNDGEVWFHKGWKEFADYHSLSHGYFMVFKYEGTSHFEVLIFDMSALEIDYPFNSTEGKKASKDQGFQVPETEISLECPPCSKRKDNSSPACGQSQKRRRTRQDHKVESTNNLQTVASHLTSTPSNESIQGKSTSRFQKRMEDSSHRPRTTNAKSGALVRASNFRSRNPFFQVVMRQSYIHKRLSIPTKFCKRYLDLENKQGNIILRVSDGRVWQARYIIRKLKSTISELYHGWKQFVEGNNLKVGDVCVFELTGRTKITFHVLIFRNNDSSNCPLSQESAESSVETKFRCTCTDSDESAMSRLPDEFTTKEFHSRSRKLKYGQIKLKQMTKGKRTIYQDSERSYSSRFGVRVAARKFNSEYPFFTSYLGSFPKVLYVPIIFIKSHIKTVRKFVKLQVGIKLWSIKLIKYPNRAFLTTGWLPFARENGLKVGDVCLFELINSDDIVMKVSIFKHLSV